MSKKIVSLRNACIIFGWFLLSFISQLKANSIFFIDLNNVVNDRLFVSLKLNNVDKDTLVLYFPKVVPGTYSVSDFGRFISNLKAFNLNEEQIKVKKISVNEYMIINASELNYITYWIDDTWDAKIRKNPIFGPNGTSFEEGKVFVLNNGGVFACVKGHEKDTINIRMNHPKRLRVSTTLDIYFKNDSSVNIISTGYHELIDAPIFVAPYDSAVIQKPGTNFKVCVYHTGQKKLASLIADEIDACLNAIEQYWGYLPIKDYTFNFYIEDCASQYGGLMEKPGLLKFYKFFKDIEAGALEHKHSSFYVLLDLGENIVSTFVKDIDFRGFLREVVIHEYLHTIAPIGLHSSEIGEIDYVNTEMSRHLWLYEGVTDYFASMVMLQSGMVDLEVYLNDKMQQRMTIGKKYPYKRMSFTEMSRNVLQKKYNKQYQYVYTYGTLLGFMLDLAIIENSEGENNLKNIVSALYHKYGYDRSFTDTGFINEFLGLAPAECGQFFNDFVTGKNLVDFNKYLSGIGIIYYENDTVKVPNLLGYNNGILDYKVRRMELILNGDIDISFVTDSSLLKPKDKLSYFEMERKTMNGMDPLVAEGDTVILNVKRNGEVLDVPFTVGIAERSFSDFFIVRKELSTEEKRNRDFWMGKPIR